MKHLITLKVLLSVFLFTGCTGGKITVSNQQITTVVSLATGLTFKYALADQSKRQVIADYVSGIAGAVRSLTGNETPEEVAKSLAKNIPQTVMQQLPEIGTIVIPQVVSYFESAKSNFGTDVKGFSDRMNAVATGLEQGVAQYITLK